MSFIFKIIGWMFALDILWWWVLARATNRKWIRAFVTIFMIAQTAGLIWLISGRLFQTGWDRWLPKFATAAIFIWHFVGLGLLSLLAITLIPILLVQQMVRISRRRKGQTDKRSRAERGRAQKANFCHPSSPVFEPCVPTRPSN